MINGIGSTSPGRLETARAQPAPRGQPATTPDKAETPTQPAAELAASGPPIDAARIAEIRAAIAAGSYRLEIMAIAAKMVEVDLPPRG